MKEKIVVGVDIGGTNTGFGFVDKKGKCIHYESIPTLAEQSAEHLFERLFDKINSLFNIYKNDYEIIGIGIGAPNANYHKGTIENPPNLKWGIVNVIKIVAKYFSVPCVITNDANAAAIGEMLFGTARGMKNFIVITLGTGLGSGIVVDGKIVYGNDGFAGELGHTIVDPNGRVCGCGNTGCLETYVSATGIKRTVFELIACKNSESKLRSISFDNLTSQIIANAAEHGDIIALEAFDYTAKILGMKLSDVVAVLSPESIVFAGGLANAGSLLLAPIKNYMEKYLPQMFKNKVHILNSSLPNGQSPILGAAALIWNEL